MKKQVKSFQSTSAIFTPFHTRFSLCPLLKDFHSSTEVKRAQPPPPEARGGPKADSKAVQLS